MTQDRNKDDEVIVDVINLWGGPGVGKSTTASDIFVALKKRQIQAELVTEYAKDMTWEKRHNVLSDQLYILAKQNRRIQRLAGQVDWVITDSPLPLGLIYKPEGYFESFEPFVMDVWGGYDNHNFLLTRDFDYQPEGRNQTLEQAHEVDRAMEALLERKSVPYHKITNSPLCDRTSQILEILGVK